MKRRIHLYFGMMLLMLVFTACSAATMGPSIWIDTPLDNTTLPLTQLTIQAHASDSNGITMFEFYIDDTLLSSLSANGGRLSEAAIEWTPPGPGTYSVKARAININGDAGGYAISVITINDAMTSLTPTPEIADPLCLPNQLLAPELLEPADGTDVSTPVHLGWQYPESGCHPHSWRIDISELADFSDISWGFGTLDHFETGRDWPLPVGCYYWRVLAYTPDTVGPPSTARSFCVTTSLLPPTATFTATFTPVPPTQTLTPTPTNTPVTPSPTPDTTPPLFIGTTVSPDKILIQGNGCPSYARETIVEAHVVDNQSALANVWAQWSLGTESGQTTLGSIGGDYYQGTVGPVTTIGTLNITIYAQDSTGNTAQSATLYVTVQNCVQ